MEGYTYIYYKPFFIYLRKGPAHIVQWPTGKTPGAPGGQSATYQKEGIANTVFPQLGTAQRRVVFRAIFIILFLRVLLSHKHYMCESVGGAKQAVM